MSLEIDGSELIWDVTSLHDNPDLLLQDLISDGRVSVEKLQETLANIKKMQTVWVICCGTSGYKDTEITGSVHGIFRSFEDGMAAMKEKAQSVIDSDESYEEIGNPRRDNVIHLHSPNGSAYRSEWKTYTLKKTFYDGDGGDVYISLCQSSFESDSDFPWVNHISIGIFNDRKDAQDCCRYTQQNNRWYSFDQDENGDCFIDWGVHKSTISLSSK